MPRIVHAEFLSYYNARRNSDKLFCVVVFNDNDGTYRCVSEYERRGSNFVRDTLCTKTPFELAISKLQQKLSAKRNHRETPYTDETFGSNYSQLAEEYGYSASRSETPGTNQTSQATPAPPQRCRAKKT